MGILFLVILMLLDVSCRICAMQYLHQAGVLCSTYIKWVCYAVPTSSGCAM